jgi:serine/threonine protein kinase
MERLTSAPNIVDMYGHCANTVVTEYAPHGLDQVLSSNPRGATESISTSANKHGEEEDNEDSISQKLDWALQTSQAVAALHSRQIVHADLQTKQFLVSTTGTIKLNDFNRCRFLPLRDDTSNGTTTNDTTNNATTDELIHICPIRIPSAPGIARSPEEYSSQALTEKIDVFSLGNVLFSILTNGLVPFGEQGSNRIKAAIRHGQKPDIPPDVLKRGSSSSSRHQHAAASLAVLVHLCFTQDPSQRIAADDLVRELQSLIDTTTITTATPN